MAPWVEELHLPHLEIPITIDRIDSVLPSGPIPVSSGDTLYLSNLDDMIGARVITPTIYFYKSQGLHSDPTTITNILREALAKVLVPYYPFSARLRQAQNGKLEVFFGPNQGALMVEAHSEMGLAQLGDLAVPNPVWSPLIYRFPDEDPFEVINMPLVIAQVTHFAYGGFSLGLRLCHCLCDGLGAMQFLGSWAETARLGVPVVNPEPCWDREFFLPRDPPRVSFPHIEFMRVDDTSSLTMSLCRDKPVQKCYRVSREFQNKLKTLTQINDTFPCTSFDAMAAHVWRSWVKSLRVKPMDCGLRLTFSVNARAKLQNPPLKKGFYGNAVCVACATSTMPDLINGSVSDTARLVSEARLNVSEEYVRSTVDYVELYRPKRLEFGGKLTITQWTRFRIYESADFGWGMPIYAGPIDLTPTPQVCVFLPEGGPDPNWAMVLCICLPRDATETFRDFLSLMDSSSHENMNNNN